MIQVTDGCYAETKTKSKETDRQTDRQTHRRRRRRNICLWLDLQRSSPSIKKKKKKEGRGNNVTTDGCYAESTDFTPQWEQHQQHSCNASLSTQSEWHIIFTSVAGRQSRPEYLV